MTQTTHTRYAVNRLRVDGKNRPLVLLTKISSGTVEDGIKQGGIIEERGTTNARYVFVGQILDSRPNLDRLDRNGTGIDEHTLFELTGADVRRMGRSNP